MVDPISICVASYSAIKAGIAAGRELQDLGSHIGKMWGAIDELKKGHTKAKNSILNMSVEEEAMQSFINLKKAEDFENSLRTIVLETRGHNAWQELIRIRTDIKKQRLEAEKERLRKRDELIENIQKAVLVIIGLFAVCMVAALFVIWWRRRQLA